MVVVEQLFERLHHIFGAHLCGWWRRALAGRDPRRTRRRLLGRCAPACLLLGRLWRDGRLGLIVGHLEVLIVWHPELLRRATVAQSREHLVRVPKARSSAFAFNSRSKGKRTTSLRRCPQRGTNPLRRVLDLPDMRLDLLDVRLGGDSCHRRPGSGRKRDTARGIDLHRRRLGASRGSPGVELRRTPGPAAIDPFRLGLTGRNPRLNDRLRGTIEAEASLGVHPGRPHLRRVALPPRRRTGPHILRRRKPPLGTPRKIRRRLGKRRTVCRCGRSRRALGVPVGRGFNGHPLDAHLHRRADGAPIVA
mmetsp:Transcript_42896/g.124728  ORF Transcript_42896/g.124728 Transcript_42896/m.124728 type:complete len:306 (+) Transcript_42896:172-1089(+)